MADIGAVPQVFGSRSVWFDTPWVGILGSTLIALAVSYLNFSDIISSVNFLYSLGMLLEFASFLRLRVKFSGVDRPYKVLLPFAGLVVIALMTLAAMFWYLLMKLYRDSDDPILH